MKAENRFESSKSKCRIRVRSILAMAVMPAFFAGCAMDHGAMEKPSSNPIPSIDFEALFVVNGGSNTVSVINASTNEIAGTITLKNANFPHHASLSPDGSLLALAIPGNDMSGGHAGGHADGHAMAGAVLLMEAATGKTKASRTFESPNHNAAYSKDGKEIWTSQMAAKGAILVLESGSLATKQTIEVGDSPAEVTFTMDGKYAFAANGKSNTVSVIDAATKSVVKTIRVGTNPVGAWPGNDSLMYVDNETSQTITAIHGATLDTVRTYTLGFTPGMAATDAKGNLWVTDADNGKVVFYPSGSSFKSGDLATGAGAHGLAFSRDGKTAYVSNQAAGTVSVIDVESRAVKKAITVGDKPNGMVMR